MSRNAKAAAGIASLLAVLAAALFVPARTIHYWQAWVYLGVFAAATTAITVDLARRDPALLARRMEAAEVSTTQRAIRLVTSVAFLAIFVVSALDHRRDGSAVPAMLALAADAAVVIGFGVVAAVFRENTYAAAIVTVERDQQVITTGPYAVVRHPMYAGAWLMLLGTPVALGSWWGLVPAAAVNAVIVWRLIDEERLLVRELPGYAAYRDRVPYRLFPRVW